jgi:hypothetical protein
MVAGKYTLFLNRDFWVQPDCHAEGSLPFWHAVLLITALAYLNPCASRPDCMGETRCGSLWYNIAFAIPSIVSHSL